VDSNTGNLSVVAGPYDPRIASSIRDVYQTADRGWTGVGFQWAALGIPSPLNCIGLTGGNFSKTSTYSYSTGQTLTENMVQTRDSPSSTTFTYAVTMNGTLPTLPEGSNFQFNNFSDPFFQNSPATARSVLNNTFLADLNNDGVYDAPYTVTGITDLSYSTGTQLPYPELENAFNINVSYDQSTGIVTLTQTATVTPASVPEPASIAIVGIALLGFCRRQNRTGKTNRTRD
jgi:hypothetical protein